MNNIIYADCTGSGTVDYKLDKVITKLVLPYYANVHSDAFCSDVMMNMIQHSHDVIKESCLINKENYALILTGNGMTGAARHFAFLLQRPVVAILYTSLEHVSNSSLWESVFSNVPIYVVNTNSNDSSFIDIRHLSQLLNTTINKTKSSGIILVAFTACSNVLGCVQPVEQITERINKYRPYALNKGLEIVTCVDCAACSPYIPLKPICHENDCIMMSPHKFKGGQGTPGVLIVRRAVIHSEIPFFPGGGTVWYKDKKECNHFLTDIEHREEGGTPNIIGIIRTGLLFARKEQYQNYILQRMHEIILQVDSFFIQRPEMMKRIHMYTSIGQHQQKRLPIFSFSVHHVHPGLFVKILSDRFGIQTRSGVSCCYLLAEQLCTVTKRVREHILSGKGTPDTYGWVRISFHYTFSALKIQYILESIELLLFTIQDYTNSYEHKCSNNKWYHKYNDVNDTIIPNIVSTLFEEVLF